MSFSNKPPAGSRQRRGSLSAQAQRGGFVVLEGLDRSGKSTQVDRLVELLNSKGMRASKLCFPDRTTVIGGLIDQYLKSGQDLDDAAIHLLFSANRWEAVQSIKQRIAQGETLVLDRYCFSGVAFTAAKETHTLEWCKGPDRGLPKPDVVCYLDVSAEVAKTRGGFGEERYEKEEFQNKVREYFDILRHEDKKLWQIVDADRPMEQVTETLGEIVVASVIKNMMLPLEDLWTDDPVAAASGAEGEQTVVKGFEMLGFGRTPS